MELKTLVLELPNGIVLAEGTDNIRDIEVRPLGGDEEDFLRDTEAHQGKNLMDLLLKRVLVRIGEEKDKKKLEELYDTRVFLADMTFILIRLRQLTLGNTYSFPLNCPECKKMGRHRIDLSTLKLIPAPASSSGHMQFETEIEGRKLQFRPLLTKDSAMLEMIRKQYRKEKGSRELSLQLIGTDTKPDLAEIKSWSWGFRNQLRVEMDAVTGGIDTNLTGLCGECNREIQFEMPMDIKSFFFPRADTTNPQTARPTLSFGQTSSSSADA